MFRRIAISLWLFNAFSTLVWGTVIDGVKTRGLGSFRETFEEDLLRFLPVYINRPIKLNECGIKFNHAFSLFNEVYKLAYRGEIDTVLESGFNQGGSNYFLRQALDLGISKSFEENNSTAGNKGSKGHIISMDPLGEPICDEDKRRMYVNSPHHTYLLGSDFVDIVELDYANGSDNFRGDYRHDDTGGNRAKGGDIVADIVRSGDFPVYETVVSNGMKLQTSYPPIDPSRAFVFLDDHVSPLARLAALQARGFRRFVLDDNYPIGQGWSRGEKLLCPKQILDAHSTGDGGDADTSIAGAEREADREAAKTRPEKSWLERNLLEYTVHPPVFHFAAIFDAIGSGDGILGWDFHRHFSVEQGGCFPEPGTSIPAMVNGREHVEVIRLLKEAFQLDLSVAVVDPNVYKEFFSYCFITYIELK